MKKRNQVLAGGLLALSLLGAHAWADDMATMQPQTSANGAEYVSGGVGDEEMAQLKSVEKDYNMRLLFTGRDGEYQSGVKVQVTDAKGNVALDTTTSGPYLLAKLPAGRYKVNAQLDDAQQTRTTVVNERGAKEVHFAW
ncbi:carboxypeptidase regulatory-like domain-containing protein [Silvimonas sp. JCM 19000]